MIIFSERVLSNYYYGFGEPGASSLVLTLIRWCGLILQVGVVHKATTIGTT